MGQYRRERNLLLRRVISVGCRKFQGRQGWGEEGREREREERGQCPTPSIMLALLSVITSSMPSRVRSSPAGCTQSAAAKETYYTGKRDLRSGQVPRGAHFPRY